MGYFSEIQLLSFSRYNGDLSGSTDKWYSLDNYFTWKKLDNWTSLLLHLADPTYMIRAIPSNASDNVYCTLLAHSAIHGAMAGYTGFTVGQVNGRHAYIPFYVSISLYQSSILSISSSFHQSYDLGSSKWLLLLSSFFFFFLVNQLYHYND